MRLLALNVSEYTSLVAPYCVSSRLRLGQLLFSLKQPPISHKSSLGNNKQAVTNRCSSKLKIFDSRRLTLLSSTSNTRYFFFLAHRTSWLILTHISLRLILRATRSVSSRTFLPAPAAALVSAIHLWFSRTLALF